MDLLTEPRIAPTAEALIETLENVHHGLADPGLREWGELLRAQAPGRYDEPPLDPFPKVVTLAAAATQGEPARPYLDVMAERVALGYAPRHPEDVIIEHQKGLGRLVHRLENGSVVRGRLMYLRQDRRAS